VLGHDLLQLPPDPVRIAALRARQQLIDPGSEPLQAARLSANRHDLLVTRRVYPLAFRHKLLVEFLTEPEADELDLDVLVRLQPREANQVSRHVDNPDRPPHVEHENLATLSHGSRLENELGGLGDGHEVSRDVGMRYADRAAPLDLPLEQRNL